VFNCGAFLTQLLTPRSCREGDDLKLGTLVLRQTIVRQNTSAGAVTGDKVPLEIVTSVTKSFLLREVHGWLAICYPNLTARVA